MTARRLDAPRTLSVLRSNLSSRFRGLAGIESRAGSKPEGRDSVLAGFWDAPGRYARSSRATRRRVCDGVHRPKQLEPRGSLGQVVRQQLPAKEAQQGPLDSRCRLVGGFPGIRKGGLPLRALHSWRCLRGVLSSHEQYASIGCTPAANRRIIGISALPIRTGKSDRTLCRLA